MSRERDRDLWGRVTKDVAPLRKKPKRRAAVVTAEPVKAPKSGKAKTVKPKPVKAKPPAPKPLPELAPGRAPGFDKRSFERFRAGKMPIEARLDLHGHTLERAHGALVEFIHRAYERDKRMLLVITG